MKKPDKPVDWDDVRYLMALLRQGSVRAAATELKVNHTTVARRLKRMERTLGCRMVQRTPEGYRATDAGKMLLSAGERIESDLGVVLSQVQGADCTIAGTVRLTLTDVLLKNVSPVLAELTQTYPGLEVEISSSPAMSDIMRLDSDIALRIVSDPPQDLVGRHIATIPVAVYAATQTGLDAAPINLESASWVRWKAPWNKVKLDIWVSENFPESATVARVDSDFALENLVAAGAGVGLLSPLTADKRDELVRLSPDIDELALDVWLLVHPDLRGVRRVKLVADALVEFFDGLGQ